MNINSIKELERIAQIVCEFSGVGLERVKGRSRKRELGTARQLIMYFAYNTSGCTYRFIGEFLGNRDHSTVGHGISHVEDLMITDFQFRAMANELDAKIKLDLTKVSKKLSHNWQVAKDSQKEF
jgi:chromosomal replication initiator protein